MLRFDSEAIYIQSRTTKAAKLTAIDVLIETLEDLMLVAATTANIEEYQLNDGQTTIRTKYRDPMQIEKTIQILERRRQRLLNQLNSRIVRAVDSKNFYHGRN